MCKFPAVQHIVQGLKSLNKIWNFSVLRYVDTRAYVSIDRMLWVVCTLAGHVHIPLGCNPGRSCLVAFIRYICERNDVILDCW